MNILTHNNIPPKFILHILYNKFKKKQEKTGKKVENAYKIWYNQKGNIIYTRRKLWFLKIIIKF